MEEEKYITVLDFEIGKVFQYKVKMCDFEKYISDKGHRLNNCQWMVHNDGTIYKV